MLGAGVSHLSIWLRFIANCSVKPMNSDRGTVCKGVLIFLFKGGGKKNKILLFLGWERQKLIYNFWIEGWLAGIVNVLMAVCMRISSLPSFFSFRNFLKKNINPSKSMFFAAP